MNLTQWQKDFIAEMKKMDLLELFQQFAEDYSQADDWDGNFTPRQSWKFSTAREEIEERIKTVERLLGKRK